MRGIGQTQDEPAGVVRVNTSRAAARLLIEPHLDELTARYPRLRLDLVMDDGMANIIADGCDAGIRLGERLVGHMVAVPITPPMRLAVAGTPKYFKKHGKPVTPKDLLRRRCICFRTGNVGIHAWEFTAPDGNHHEFAIEPQGVLTTNDDEGTIRAALQHIGLVQHLETALRPYFRNGRLAEVLEAWSTPFAGFYLYVPSRAHMPSKIRVLIDFLTQKRKIHGAS